MEDDGGRGDGGNLLLRRRRAEAGDVQTRCSWYDGATKHEPLFRREADPVARADGDGGPAGVSPMELRDKLLPVWGKRRGRRRRTGTNSGRTTGMRPRG